MPKTPPPPAIDSARVLSYAFVDDISYRQYGRLIVGDKIMEAVPRLAIVVNLGKDIGPMLFHCDEEWNCLGTSGAASVVAVKQRADLNYPGVASRWVDVNTSVEEALQFYDDQTGALTCDFCGKRPFDFNGCTEGRSAVICRGCIEAYYKAFQESDSEKFDLAEK
jgi:hypothetical protein